MKITEKMVRSLFPRQIKGAKKVREARLAYQKGKITPGHLEQIYFFYTK